MFTEPGGGWSSETQAATLSDSRGAEPFYQPAISGQTVVLGEEGRGTSFEDVFVEPPGGWSGTVEQAATLVPSDGASVPGADPPAISGGTVAEVGFHNKGSVYVFSEPAGGWAGTVHEVAKLTDPSGMSLGAPTISGPIIVAPGNGKADVFIEPAGGWSGAPRPAATLTDPFGAQLFPVAISGRTVLAGGDVFTEPARGWSGTITPAARLIPGSRTSWYAWSSTTSRDRVAASTGNLGGEHQCPCTGAVWVFTRPSRGWSGPIVASPALPVSEGPAIPAVALQDRDLFVAGARTVEVYELTGTFGQTSRPPALTNAVARGLPKGRPQLRFRISADANVTPLESFTLALPSGLSFTASRRQLTRYVAIGGAEKHTISLGHGKLTVALRGTTARLAVTIRPGALLENQALVKRIANARRAGRVTSLSFPVNVSETLGTARQWWLPSSISKQLTFRIAVR